MSESGESVDNEIEICIPKSVAVDEGGEVTRFPLIKSEIMRSQGWRLCPL